MKSLSAGAIAAAIPESIGRALALPANNLTGTIADIEHVVILMQENRSFDHYFGTLNGVRGFGDPRAVMLPTGNSVFYQPGGPEGYTLPFRPQEADLGLTFIEDLPHDWATTHAAWNGGRYDGWIAAKTTTTMAYLTRQDIPFHYALADAFTICDAYHCSLMGPTSPNRYYMWSGWVGNDGKNGGPVVDNATNGYSWTTFPERLTAAEITWKVYQDLGTGLDASQGYGETSDALIGNYGDNALLYFTQYQTAKPGSPLYQGALTGTRAASGQSLFDIFSADVAKNRLPQVSWVVAPEAYTEHPNWPANYGAFYISKILDALTANPTVWSKTAFIITYDENDGFFDHAVPPTPPVDDAHGKSTVSLVNEYFPGNTEHLPGVYGLGIRIPCFVISPWSKGGYVNSQVFDHTSLIRFVASVFGHRAKGDLHEPNITPWRAAVCGDLTSAFNFRTPNAAAVKMPSTSAYKPPNSQRQNSYVPVPPVKQALPRQEPGVRRARPLPYEIAAYATVSPEAVELTFATTGTQTAVFQVRSGNPLVGPRIFTVEPGKSLSDRWALLLGAYDLSVTGPNGFFRRFTGDAALGASHLRVRETYVAATQTFLLSLQNISGTGLQVSLLDSYTGATTPLVLAPRAAIMQPIPLERTQGWYDIRVTLPGSPGYLTQLAGHTENGRESITDPLISWA